MKKYLMMSMAAVALAGTFTSCSKEKDLLDPEAAQNQIVLNYQQAFIKTFGQPAANHTWGFGSSLTRAGSDAYFERWQDDRKWVKPHDIIEAERDYVLEYLQEHPNGGYKTLDIDTYVIQVVGGGHHEYTGDTPDNNGHVQKVSDATTQMNYCEIDGFFTQYNNNDMNSEGCILIANVPAKDATYHDSYGSTWRDHYAFYFITFPNDAKYGYMAGQTGCYLCYDFATYKKSESWGVTADGIYDDWVIKLSPSTGGFFEEPGGDDDDDDSSTTVKKADLRVMAEDLSAADASDFDFNDVVFDVFYGAAGEAYVEVVAAGGTLPLYVNGVEVHGLFEQPTNVMINTNASGKGLAGVEDQPAKKITLNFPVNSPEDAEGIEIKVTKQVKNAATGELEDKDFVLEAAVGAPACKVAVPAGTPYASERENVNNVFNFSEWVQNENIQIVANK